MTSATMLDIGFTRDGLAATEAGAVERRHHAS
jgi:hypothetical protein